MVRLHLADILVDTLNALLEYFCADMLEDEIHCLMSCKLNIDEREKLFSKISEYNKTFNRLNDKAKFIYLLGSTQICDENVYQFINQCLKNSYSVKK